MTSQITEDDMGRIVAAFLEGLDAGKGLYVWGIRAALKAAGVTIVDPDAVMAADPTETALADVAAERRAQDTKWGPQNHPDGTGIRHLPLAPLMRDYARTLCDGEHKAGRGTWEMILAEEFWEAAAEEDPAQLRTELIQVAAVAVAWVEAIDRRPPADTSMQNIDPEGVSALRAATRQTPPLTKTNIEPPVPPTRRRRLLGQDIPPVAVSAANITLTDIGHDPIESYALAAAIAAAINASGKELR